MIWTKQDQKTNAYIYNVKYYDIKEFFTAYYFNLMWDQSM